MSSKADRALAYIDAIAPVAGALFGAIAKLAKGPEAAEADRIWAEVEEVVVTARGKLADAVKRWRETD